MGDNARVVRCVDCLHAGPLVNYVCRCAILRIGKTGRAKRVCDHFKSNRDGEEKKAGHNSKRGREKDIASDTTRGVKRGERKGDFHRVGKGNGQHAEATGIPIQFPQD